MSDLFYTGRRKTGGGSINVTTKGGAELAKKLRKLEDGGKVAIQRTVSDFTSRAPAWVTKGIREHYGVDAKAIKDAAKQPKRGKTSIKVGGINVDGATLRYEGRTLTPIHFGMSPKKRPDAVKNKPILVPGQAIATGRGSDVATIRPPKKYKVKATIIKGQRVTLGAQTFITQGQGGVSLPFQKTGEGRMPIEAVRTLSVPQMIDGRAHDTIEQMIGDNLTERFTHHMDRVMKQAGK